MCLSVCLHPCNHHHIHDNEQIHAPESTLSLFIPSLPSLKQHTGSKKMGSHKAPLPV